MRSFVLPLSLAALGAFRLVVAQEQEPLKIQVTFAVECERTTRKGDTIAVNYRGNLTTGEEFDNNKSSLAPTRRHAAFNICAQHAMTAASRSASRSVPAW